MITHDQLVEMFEAIARDTKWDMSKPMLWGYFFTDVSREKLERIVPLLEAQGYRFVEIFLSDDEEDDEDEAEAALWWLHVEKVEVHTPDTLDEQNQAFYELADEHDLESYDGMDVGPAPVTH